ncbi:uncharacterized protein [Gossypium hirsutum]|uniref:Gag-pro-like protein n=1 Tax=Gossypium hirsutum TaxID=3635 RepID=A0A1U8PBB7_GOSHI|nr:uncharacterized protein LOC107957453 [Gossypium hirsutum]
MTPDRITLQNMEKKPNENFRQYVQMWREVAMQVQPPLLEKETTMLFINILKASFITHMIGITIKSFADIVMAGEMIENTIRGGKIEGEVTKISALRRKDNEVNNTRSFNSKTVTVGQPKAAAVGQQGSQGQESGTKHERMQFTPIPVTYRELYQSLCDAHAINPFHLKPLQPPYPKWYDANARCEYHAGISGHSIKNCTGFKKVVERLIKIGVVKFDNTLNTENPLPNHNNQGVNAIGEAGEMRMKKDVAKVRMPMKVIWEEMMKRGMLTCKNERGETRNYGEFHEKGHEIQNCEEFKALVQGFIDNKELQIFEGSSCEKQVCALEEEQKGTSRPRIIIFLMGNNEVGTQTVSMPEKEDIASASKEAQGEGSHTRSGKRYDVVGVREETTKTKNVSTEKEKEAEVPIKEPVKEEEAKEFLKFLKHSEYSVVEQLRKQPARISVLALLLSSKVHQDALMKLDRLVNNIRADNFIYFNDDEIPPRGRGSTKALHITTRCKEFVNATFISEGSELSVPKIARATRMALQMMAEKGALPRKGLGKHLQGGIKSQNLKRREIALVWASNQTISKGGRKLRSAKKEEGRALTEEKWSGSR